MKTTAEKLQEDTSSEKMSTLSSAINHAVKNGYTTEFSVQDNGMLWDNEDRYFDPQEVFIENFYRFEGESDPGDSSILYLISTTDGKRGVLIDAYGAYDDANVSEFIRKVSEINKKTSPAGKSCSHTAQTRYLVAATILLVLGGLLLLSKEKKK